MALQLHLLIVLQRQLESQDSNPDTPARHLRRRPPHHRRPFPDEVLVSTKIRRTRTPERRHFRSGSRSRIAAVVRIRNCEALEILSAQESGQSGEIRLKENEKIFDDKFFQMHIL